MAKPQDDQEIYGAPLDLPDTEPQAQTRKPRSKSGFRYVRIMLITFVLILIAACVYYFLLRPKDGESTTSNTTNTTTNEKVEPTKNAKSTKLKKHSGDFPRMELQYPADWTLVEKDNSVTITSTDFEYETVSKGVVKGNFSIYIRMGAREQEGKYIGRGLAVRPSEKLVYDEPSSSQRKDTNLTLFGLDSSDYFSYFLVSGDYDLKKGDTLGPTYGREADTYIIAGGFGSSKQSDPLDYNDLDFKTAVNDKAYKQGIAILKSIKVY